MAVLLACLLGPSVSALAGTYTWLAPRGNAHDLEDLAHHRKYTWGIQDAQLQALKDELATGLSMITSARIRFEDFYNWRYEPSVLYMHLIDDARVGLRRGYDFQYPSDAFEGQGILISDPQDLWMGGPGVDPNTNIPSGYSNRRDIEWEFVHLTDADGNNVQFYAETFPVLGFAFDPDCHFYNNGVSVTIETQTLPPGVHAVPLPTAAWGGLMLMVCMASIKGVRRFLRRDV